MIVKTKLISLLILLLLPSFSLAADISVPTNIPVYSIGEIEYTGKANVLFWSIPPQVSTRFTNSLKTVYFTAPPGAYTATLNAITVDWDAKTVTQSSESFTLNVLPINPKPEPEPDPNPPVPPNPTAVKKIVVLYETDSKTPEFNNLLYELRVKAKVPLYFLDNDLPNQFNLTEDGVYFLDSTNKTIKKAPLPTSVDDVLSQLP